MNAFFPAGTAGTDRGRARPRSVGEWFDLTQRFSRQQSLEARVETLLLRVEHRPQAEQDRLAEARILLDRAKASLGASFELALRYANEAERLLVRESSDAERMARVESLERDVLLRWPESQVIPILAILKAARESGDGETDRVAPLLVEALRLYHDRILKLYAEQERVRDRLVLLGWVLVGVLALLAVGLLGFEGAPAEFLGTAADPDGGWSILCAVAFGGAGACVSAMTSFTYLRRAPDEFETFWITAARPLIGAAAGLVALAVAGAGLLSLAGESVPKIAALAFLFGFSERLIIGTVEKFEAKEGVARK